MTHDEAVKLLRERSEYDRDFAREFPPPPAWDDGKRVELKTPGAEDDAIADLLEAWARAWDGLTSDIQARVMLSESPGAKVCARSIEQLARVWDLRNRPE